MPERGFEMNKKELVSLTIEELKTLAKKNKIALPAGAKKTDMVKALAKTASAATNKTAKAAVKKGVKKSATKSAKRTVTSASSKKKGTAKALPKERIASRKTAATKPVGEAMPRREWQMPTGVEEPLMAQERVSDAKYYTGMPEHKPPMPYDTLPHEYGGERMALLARDPYMALSYWELPQARLEKEKAWFGWDSKLCVRVYDVTGIQFDGSNAAAYFDQEVYERVGSWYFDLGRPTHSFCADLGLMAPNGRFLTLVRSNRVIMPRDGVSDVLDEEWMLVDEEFMKLYGVPGSVRGVHGGLTSPEAQEVLRQRRLLEITSPGTFPKQKPRKK
jgi:hypothetical protein